MIRTGVLLLIALVFAALDSMGESWKNVLAAMPLPQSALPLRRENCISICLTNFRSNAVVKALIFLPGVSDDLYLIDRDKKDLAIEAGNLFEALCRLTNSTRLSIIFREPFLLVHTARDRCEPAIIFNHSSTVTTLMERRSIPELVCSDAHWDSIQPILQKSLHMRVRPLTGSKDDWHFNRHNLAAYGATDLELVSALSLTARTTASIQRKRVIFDVRTP